MIKKRYSPTPKILNNSAEIDPTRIGSKPFDKTAFKLEFCTKWIKNIPKLHTHIHGKNMSLFPTAIAEFKMLRLTLPQKKILLNS